MSDATFTRRFVLEGALVTVTAFSLPSCIRSDNGIGRISSDGKFFNADQLTVINDVAEIMIPRTETPGAADAQVASVIDGLMLTWAGKESKTQLREVLTALEARARAAFGENYATLAQAERSTVVEAFDVQSFSDDPPSDAGGYKKLKYLVFRVFYTSEESSANYVAVPGQYSGNLTLEEYESLMEQRGHG